MTLSKILLLLSVSGLAVLGWAGSGMVARHDLIAGAALNTVLPPDAWSESADEITFAVIGDAGTGGRNQFSIASQMAQTYLRQPFGLLLTTGDNVYFGGVVDRAKEVIDKPYKPLFDAGIEFRPALGNHDVDQVDDEDDLPSTLATLGMPNRYYQFTRGPVDFFALDSNDVDDEQLSWLTAALSCSTSQWQVVYFHHPLYSSGMHGSGLELRTTLETVLVSGGADIVFAGHDHNYERTLPQQGVVYVVTGGGGGEIRSVGFSEFTAVSEADHHFILAQTTSSNMLVTALDDHGELLDAFVLSPRTAQVPCFEQ